MKALNKSAIVGLFILTSVFQVVFGGLAESEQGDLVRVYEVDKKVCDFPEGEDLSTPEAAYATANRFSASGEQNWQRISVKRLTKRMRAQKGKRKVSKSAAHGWLNANIVEVRIFQGK